MILWNKSIWPFRRTRSASGCTVVAYALPALVALAGCGDGPPTPVAGEGLLGMSADMVSYDVVTYMTNAEGIRSGRIRADSAYYYLDSTVVHRRGVEMDVYAEEGLVRATVTAERGRYDERTQQMHAVGDVVLVFPNESRRLESDELHYNPLTEDIRSDSASTYHYDGQTTRGTCFRSDMTFRNYQVCDIRGSAELGG